MESCEEKLKKLKEIIKEGGPCLIAFSGGIDSFFLLHVAAEVLPNQVLALTGISASIPKAAVEEAKEMVKILPVQHLCLDSKEVENPSYAKNPANRCFFCKEELFRICREESQRRNITTIYDGTNFDDLQEHRPGLLAAKQCGIRSPMVEVKLTKDEIRRLSKDRGIKGWAKPASPCLASRFPTGVAISPARLKKVEEFETFLRSLGFEECRVRFFDSMARIEVLPDMVTKVTLPPIRQAIVSKGVSLGFSTVAIDLEGYRRGKLNSVAFQRDRIYPEDPERSEGDEGSQCI